MAHDTLILECPVCKEQFPVATYAGDCSNAFYGIENVPLKILAEVNEKSKKGQIQCIDCGLTIAVQVLFLPYVRPFSSVGREGWRSE